MSGGAAIRGMYHKSCATLMHILLSCPLWVHMPDFCGLWHLRLTNNWGPTKIDIEISFYELQVIVSDATRKTSQRIVISYRLRQSVVCVFSFSELKQLFIIKMCGRVVFIIQDQAPTCSKMKWTNQNLKPEPKQNYCFSATCGFSKCISAHIFSYIS